LDVASQNAPRPAEHLAPDLPTADKQGTPTASIRVKSTPHESEVIPMPHDKRVVLSAGGVTLSRLVLGAWRLLDQGMRPGAETVARLIDEAVGLGLTSFDHADIYGNYGVEEAFGAGLRHWNGARRSIELVTKCDIMQSWAEIAGRTISMVWCPTQCTGLSIWREISVGFGHLTSDSRLANVILILARSSWA